MRHYGRRVFFRKNSEWIRMKGLGLFSVYFKHGEWINYNELYIMIMIIQFINSYMQYTVYKDNAHGQLSSLHHPPQNSSLFSQIKSRTSFEIAFPANSVISSSFILFSQQYPPIWNKIKSLLVNSSWTNVIYIFRRTRNYVIMSYIKEL